MQDLGIVNKSVKRSDALAKTLGMAKFTGDLKRKDMLVGKALFPVHAHALIKRIDTSKAKELPGVEAVMTAADIPGRNGYGIMCPDKPVIAEKKVCYEGDPVVLVAAVDEETAQKALSLIEVDYEVLEAYDDPRDALKEGAVLIHENHPVAEDGNLLTTVKVDSGDFEKAFQEADIIIENDYETPIVEHCYMEPDICIAEYDPLTQGLVLTSPQQAAYATIRSLAPVFNLKHSQVRAVCSIVGGGFGGKEDSVLDVAAVAGVLALKTKKTVYFELTREEVFKTTGKRHPTYIKHRLAATKDGKITGIDVTTILGKGAYVSMGGIQAPLLAVTMRTAIYAGGTYYVPNARVRSHSVFTNAPYSCAFRGFGAPQAHFAIECQMDELARKLNMDPVELRMKNILRDGDRTIYGQVMKKSRGLGLEECVNRVKEQMKWDSLTFENDGSVKRGKGMAVFMYGTGIPLLFEGAHCYINTQTDGSVNVAVSSTEMGQGLITAMTQIAAETLGVRFEDVVISISDSGASPDGGPTVGSRATTLVGNAVMDGCNKLKKRFLDFAATQFNADPRDLEIKDGKVFVVGKQETEVPFASIVSKAFVNQVPLSVVGTWYPPKPSFRGEDGQGTPMHAYTFGAQGIVAAVDVETGEITIERSVIACDVGKAINPAMVEGQLEGGVAQAIGWALMEESIMKKGIMENTTFHKYLVPSTKDLPDLESIIVEHPNELGPYGAKGIGEPPIIPGAPAIRNALYDALNIKMNTIPFTADRVLDSIYAQVAGKEVE